ncbi:hypothetical protein BKA61DRAFT_663261, partial [Leptodontidium sp. MPI-SDFR-AT-0119]
MARIVFRRKDCSTGLIVLKEDDIQMRFNSCGGDGARNATDSSVIKTVEIAVDLKTAQAINRWDNSPQQGNGLFQVLIAESVGLGVVYDGGTQVPYRIASHAKELKDLRDIIGKGIRHPNAHAWDDELLIYGRGNRSIEFGKISSRVATTVSLSPFSAVTKSKVDLRCTKRRASQWKGLYLQLSMHRKTLTSRWVFWVFWVVSSFLWIHIQIQIPRDVQERGKHALAATPLPPLEVRPDADWHATPVGLVYPPSRQKSAIYRSCRVKVEVDDDSQTFLFLSPLSLSMLALLRFRRRPLLEIVHAVQGFGFQLMGSTCPGSGILDDLCQFSLFGQAILAFGLIWLQILACWMLPVGTWMKKPKFEEDALRPPSSEAFQSCRNLVATLETLSWHELGGSTR